MKTGMWRAVVVAGMALGAVVTYGAPTKERVAPGFADWRGVEQKNRIFGRTITASDLRQRAVIVIVLDAGPQATDIKKLGDELRMLSCLKTFVKTPDWLFSWDLTEELSRDCIVLFVMRGKCTSKEIWDATRARPDEADGNSATLWTDGWSAFYANLELEGCPMSEGECPYVYVFGPTGNTPLWKGTFTTKCMKDVAVAVSKAKKDMGKWALMTGVEDPVFFKKEMADLLAGKPTKGVLSVLQAGVKDVDPDKAKEAQIMYDAVFQYRSELLLRVNNELSTAPARAYADTMRFQRMFPQDKNLIASSLDKLKSNKSAQVVGKYLEQFLSWNFPGFTVKSEAEAKKLAKQTVAWHKPLAKIANDQSNAAVAGEAALLLAQLDGLADVLASKVVEAK